MIDFLPRKSLRLPIISLILGGGALIYLTLTKGVGWTFEQLLIWVAAIALVVPLVMWLSRRK